MESECYTAAGKQYLSELTRWLQETRLMSEAIFRLRNEHRTTGLIQFNAASWPKPKKPEVFQATSKEFVIEPVALDERVSGLLKSLWATRFVFLETLWEEYLQNLVSDLRQKDAAVFEPFCEQKFMAQIIRDVLTGEIDTVAAIKDEVATRFATGITRQPWSEQWKQLNKLKIGLSDSDESQSWFKTLDVYFEMRNCIVHQQGRVSALLQKKSDYYRKYQAAIVAIGPSHLDFYRHQFIDCLMFIEEKCRVRDQALELAPAFQKPDNLIEEFL